LIQTYPSSILIPQRPPTRPRRLPRPVVERHPRYSQSINPNIPLIPLDTPEASHSASTSPASSCRKRPPLFPVHRSNIPLIPLNTPEASHSASTSTASGCRKTPPYSQSIDPNVPLIPPNTPGASHSTSTSSASLVSPQTLPNAHRPEFIKVVSADSSLVEVPVIPHSHGLTFILVKPTKAVASAVPTSSAVAPKKPKSMRGQFAYATRAVR
jgi:hypothetical protein